MRLKVTFQPPLKKKRRRKKSGKQPLVITLDFFCVRVVLSKTSKCWKISWKSVFLRPPTKSSECLSERSRRTKSNFAEPETRRSDIDDSSKLFARLKLSYAWKVCSLHFHFNTREGFLANRGFKNDTVCLFDKKAGPAVEEAAELISAHSRSKNGKVVASVDAYDVILWGYFCHDCINYWWGKKNK